jgi:hypothetical protein
MVYLFLKKRFTTFSVLNLNFPPFQKPSGRAGSPSMVKSSPDWPCKLQHTVDLWRKSTQGHSQDKNKKRAHKGQQDQSSECFGCLQDEDNTEYILIQRVYARQAWYNMFEV